jgi:hypothetical protein
MLAGEEMLRADRLVSETKLNVFLRCTVFQPLSPTRGREKYDYGPHLWIFFGKNQERTKRYKDILLNNNNNDYNNNNNNNNTRPPLWSSDQSSWLQIRRPGFDSRHYKGKKLMSLERGPLSLVSTTEELLDRKVAAPV